jgi:AcrR family transcriptional regulator
VPVKKKRLAKGLGPRKTRGTPAETAERLVLSAAEEFNERGYFSTDSNRIAERAGYSPGTFYKHFPDKRAIFLAAYAWWVETIWANVEREFAEGAPDPRRRAERIVHGVIRTHRTWIGFRRDLRHLSATDDEVRRFYLAQRGEQLELLLARAPGARGATHRAGAALLLFSMERTADAVADGEALALGLSERVLVDALVDKIVAFGAE